MRTRLVERGWWSRDISIEQWVKRVMWRVGTFAHHEIRCQTLGKTRDARRVWRSDEEFGFGSRVRVVVGWVGWWRYTCHMAIWKNSNDSIKLWCAWKQTGTKLFHSINYAVLLPHQPTRHLQTPLLAPILRTCMYNHHQLTNQTTNQQINLMSQKQVKKG